MNEEQTNVGAESVLAADIAKQVVMTKQYVDPVKEAYWIQKQNIMGAPSSRESAEGIAFTHQLIHCAGRPPEAL